MSMILKYPSEPAYSLQHKVKNDTFWYDIKSNNVYIFIKKWIQLSRNLGATVPGFSITNVSTITPNYTSNPMWRQADITFNNSSGEDQIITSMETIRPYGKIHNLYPIMDNQIVPDSIIFPKGETKVVTFYVSSLDDEFAFQTGDWIYGFTTADIAGRNKIIIDYTIP